MAKKTETEWFIEPTDQGTNKTIWTVLRDSGNEDGIMVGAKGSDGRTHSVYRVPDHETLIPFVKNRTAMNLHFNIYNRRSSRGKLRPWPFERGTT
ncbi:MAG: hypothetical protein WC246_01025 [Candidatus Paceibacterota bacterium]|jgi:hypothetical protein